MNKKPRIHQEIKDAIVEQYKTGVFSMNQLSKNYKISYTSVRLCLQAQNIPFKKTCKRLTQEQKNKILDLYTNNNYNCLQVANLCDTNSTTVNKFLKLNNIPIRFNSATQYRKHTFNENYFDIIDTEEKAYILGLLAADGYIRHGEIAMSLQEEDKEILEKIKVCLESTYPLKFVKPRQPTHKNQYLLNLSSVYLSKRLAELGLVQKKSLILKFPTENQIPKFLLRHYIRGYFDGDGSLSFCIRPSRGSKTSKRKTKSPSNTLSSNITGSTIFINELKKYLEEILNLNFTPHINKKNEATTTLFINGNMTTYKFLIWLYEDCNIFLKRKKDKYLEAGNYLYENKLSIYNKKHLLID